MASSPSTRARPRAWTTLGLLFLTAIIAYTDRQVLSLLVGPVKVALRIDDVQVGLLIGTAFGLIYATVGLPLGWLADRVSRKRLLLTGVGIWSFGTAGCGLATDFNELFLSRMLVGIGEAALSPVAVSLIGDIFAPARRGRALGIYFAGIEAGAGASILIGAWLMQMVRGGLPGGLLSNLAAWRGVFVLLGGAGAVLFVILLVSLHEPARVTTTAPSSAMEGDAGGWIRLIPIYLAVALVSLLENAIGAWGPSVLIDDFGSDLVHVGELLGPCMIVGGCIGVLTGGMLADRGLWRRTAGRSRRGAAGRDTGCVDGHARRDKVLLLMVAGPVYVVASLTLLSTHETVALLGIAGLFTLTGFITAVGLSTILESTPNHRRGVTTSLSFFLNVLLGSGTGPVLAAVFARSLFGSERALAPALVTLGVAVVAVMLGLLSLVFGRRNRTAISPA